jgi:hypothetical protein
MDISLDDEYEALECLRRLSGELRTTAAWLFERIDAAGPGDPDANSCMKAAIEALSLLGRVQHGTLTQFLARAHQNRALPGGVPAFLAATQGVSHGRARSLVEDAQRITVQPEINQYLAEGRLSPEGTRVVARTLKAVIGMKAETQRQAVVDAMETIEAKGVTEANRQIPRFEEKSESGSLEDIIARQRLRSFARMTVLDHGACRFDILLDGERALRMRAALDAFDLRVRRRQSVGLAIVPGDVRTAEQIAAEAFTRLAEVFLNSSNEKREAGFRVPTLLYGTLDVPNPVAETIYGDRLPGSILPQPDDPATDVVLFDREGRVVSLNGDPIDGGRFRNRKPQRRQKKFAFRSRLATD